MMYQKTTQNAIAAVSRLAETFADSECLVSSRDIAESRSLPIPIVAKILTELSRGGLIVGSPGPGGGYRLARPPAEVSLRDVVDLFERESPTACPYGPSWCGHGDPCPLHDSMIALRQKIDDYLSRTTFAVFAKRKRGAGSKKRRR